MRCGWLVVCVVVSGGVVGAACTSKPAPPAKVDTGVAGDAVAGKAYWARANTLCSTCHGEHGEGAFGPPLAGRHLTDAQFTHQVRKPWGLMPRWTTQQVSDGTLADVNAYLASLPGVSEPGPWQVTVPPDAPLAVRYWVETVGCGQCHGVDLKEALTGAEGQTDYAWVAKRAYAHTEDFPTGAMGTYSKDRLPEMLLEEIWRATQPADDTGKTALRQ